LAGNHLTFFKLNSTPQNGGKRKSVMSNTWKDTCFEIGEHDVGLDCMHSSFQLPLSSKYNIYFLLKHSVALPVSRSLEPDENCQHDNGGNGG
jgi:hypothetical protein